MCTRMRRIWKPRKKLYVEFFHRNSAYPPTPPPFFILILFLVYTLYTRSSIIRWRTCLLSLQTDIYPPSLLIPDNHHWPYKLFYNIVIGLHEDYLKWADPPLYLLAMYLTLPTDHYSIFVVCTIDKYTSSRHLLYSIISTFFITTHR